MRWPFNSKSRYPISRHEEIDSHSYDYIVIGGGTAGCVVASRLSEDPNVSVLVLECGAVNDTWMSRVPLISCNIMDPNTGAAKWPAEPMKHCDGRQSLVFRGEVLGGTSRINAMLYTRGTAADYDAWSAMGHPDWSYEKVLPYFVKSENSLNQPKSNHHGSSGPWITQSFTYPNWLFGAYKTVQECVEAMGFSFVSDLNAPNAPSEMIANVDVTINQKRQRVSTFDAFIPKEIAQERRNLTICTGATVSEVLFSDNAGNQNAVEVLFQKTGAKSTKAFSAKVKREVIVCAGAIGSPQILMLSGIGPREHLEEHGIKIIRDLPGVGSELTDHFGIPVEWEVPVAESTHHLQISMLKAATEFFKYFFNRTGLLSMAVQPIAWFVRSTSLDNEANLVTISSVKSLNEVYDADIHRPQDFIPDIELITLTVSSMDEPEERKPYSSKIGIFSCTPTLLQPKSRGTVRLASANPHDRPKVDFGILSDPEDLIIARKGVRLALKLGAAMKSKGYPIIRGVCVPKSSQDQEDVDIFIRSRIKSMYHYSSTCRMAPENDKKAPGVVDDTLTVHGIQNLRVCDASIFPQIISSHLQAPVVMVAEKCADLIITSW